MKMKKFMAVLLTLVVFVVPMFANGVNEKTITILETSDIHGTIAPWDYASDKSYDGSLAQAATIIKQQRAIDPELLLLDCGDSLQDNMIQEFRFDEENPMIKAMNYLEYDAWELGNHEFNFEYNNLLRAINQANFPVLGGNIVKADGTPFVNEYIVRNIDGVSVAIFGIEAPHVTRWEASNPEHYNLMTFRTPMEQTERMVKELYGKYDVLICLAHYGEDGEYETAGMREIAQKYGDKVNAFLIGHAHSNLCEQLDNGTWLIEPGSKCSNVGKVTITLQQLVAGGKWFVTATKGELLPIYKAKVPSDKDFMALMNYVYEEARAKANKVVGQVGADFLPSQWWNDLEGIPTAIVQDTAMMDLINKIQMEETGADTSLAALFTTQSNLKKGDFKKRDGVLIYKYDNTLMAVRVTGAQLKEIIELRAGTFFNEFTEGDYTISFDPKIRMYNYDMFAGVNYDIDISRPAGDRIVNITFNGEPLKADQELVLAMNNYRYGGLSGAGLISAKPEDLVYNTGLAIRDLIADYVEKSGTIMPECDNNWKIIGYEFPADKDAVYAKIRAGEIKIPVSEDGRTPNIKSINIKDIK